MPESRRFGDPAKMELEIRWVDDPEPSERRPAEYGWSMGQLTIRVAGMNVTATTLGGEQRAHVYWYLGPFLDWLATNWVALLHEERLPWPSPGSAPAALACNHALDEWMIAEIRRANSTMRTPRIGTCGMAFAALRQAACSRICSSAA